MSDATNRRRTTVQSISRAAAVLELLADARRPMTVLQLARAAELDRTVVHRTLRTLADADLVTATGTSYGIGPAALRLGFAHLDSLDVLRLGLPYMIDLSVRSVQDRPWLVSLAVPVRTTMVLVERIWTPSAPLGLVMDVGTALPMTTSAMGRAFLSCLEPQEVETLLGPEDAAALAPVLARARTCGGVATSSSEVRANAEALAAPITDTATGRPVAVVAVSGLQLGEEAQPGSALATQVLRTADRIGVAVSGGRT